MEGFIFIQDGAWTIWRKEYEEKREELMEYLRR